MRNIFYFLFFFCVFSNGYGQSQKYIVIDYEEKFKITNEEKKDLPPEIIKILEKHEKWKATQLIQIGYKSVYSIAGKKTKSAEVVKEESITKTFEASVEKQFFKNLKKMSFKTQIDFKNEIVLIDEKLKKYDWKLINEEKEINGVKCKKATSIGEEGVITAWYSDEFGVQNGPKNYHGLPGIIFFLEHDYQVFRLKKVTFLEKLKLPTINNKAVVVTRDEYNEIYVNKDKKVLINEERKGNEVIKNYRGKSINVGKKQ